MTDRLFSRNWAFIDAKTQDKLQQATLLTAGTGLGSGIATLAARTGFGRFILADGDVVEVSNLNRQAFLRRHIGRNKARATAELIAEINENAIVETIPEYLTEATLAAPISRSAIVVNTIDFDDPVFLACNRIAREQGRPVLLPLNIGWGAALYAFLPNSPSIEDVLSREIAAHGVSAIRTELVLRAVGAHPHRYIHEPMQKFIAPDQADWPFDPQLGVAAAMSASLTVAAAVALAKGEPIRAFPEVATVDAWVSVTAPDGGGAR
jgi:molybdopterin/thiamine biosynthesis adenylyltransferase